MMSIRGKRYLRKFVQKFVLPRAQCSYSQFGEDLIAAHFFAAHDIKYPSYIDIGANEPRYISNTVYFYDRGSAGVLIEPNPFLYKKLKRNRPKDVILNTGVGITDENEADFYLFPDYANGLSTFSEKEAKHWQEVGLKGLGKIPLDKIIKMPLTRLNNILKKYFSDKPLHLMSLDVEGLDLDILKSIDFNLYRPMLICVETLMYNSDQTSYKSAEVSEFMLTKNYRVYADTHVNTIFADNNI